MLWPNDLCKRGWELPQQHPHLRINEIHVWLVTLDVNGHTLGPLWATLDKSEHNRAKRFHVERDQHYFIAAHAALRTVLGHYVGVPAADVRFTHNAHGKPRLDDSHSLSLRFNLSHSGNLALFAITHHREVGIDVEYIRPDIDGEELARCFFTAREQAELQRLPAPQRVNGFYHHWTRKEAYVKAHGMGLALPLNRFAISLEPDPDTHMLQVLDMTSDDDRWSLVDIDLGENHAAAIASEGQNWYTRQLIWTWPA